MRTEVLKALANFQSLVALDNELSMKDWEFINEKIKEIKERL